MYDSVYDFNKHSVSNFNKITSFDSKFDTLNNFYKEFIKLLGVKSKTVERKQKKITVLKNASSRYDELLRDYKKEYNQVFKSKDKERRLKYSYKNLEDVDYQPEQLQPEQLVLPKWIKVRKNRFGEIQNIVTEAKINKSKAKVGNEFITVNSTENLINLGLMLL